VNEASSLVVVSSCPKAPTAKKRMVMNEVRVVNFMMVVLEMVVVGYDVVDRRTDPCLIYTVTRSIRGVCGASNENKRGANEA